MDHDFVGKCYRLGCRHSQEINSLHADIAQLKIALHDAIRRPMGVVPASADDFYSPAEADAAERRRAERANALSELAAADAVLLDLPEGDA